MFLHIIYQAVACNIYKQIMTSVGVSVLVGTGRACFESLRPLAYSLLAEIVHHVRGDLSLSQVLNDKEIYTVFNVDLNSLDSIISETMSL